MTKKSIFAPLLIFIIVLVGGIFIWKHREIPAKKENPQSNREQAEGILSGSGKNINITAKQFSFEPAEIRVKKGDKVVLIVKSVDVKHGFSLPEFGIDEKLEPGKETRIEFTADKVGSFTFRCSVFCGQGHSEMTGTLIVEE